MRRLETDLERLQKRLDVLYDDRLDGRIEAARYDQKANEIREDQQRLRTKMNECQMSLPPVREAVNLIALTSQAAHWFAGQSACEQRKLLHIIRGDAVWQGGESGCASERRLRNCDSRTPQVQQTAT